MSLLRKIAAGLRALFHKQQADRELDAELRSYLETATEAKIAAGMSRDRALRAARMELGSVEAVKEDVRAAGWESFLETIWQDLRFATRMLRKSPGFTAVAVLTLALGIGANTAIFSVVNAVLLRPLPFPRSDRIVLLLEELPGFSSNIPFNAPSYRAFLERQRSFEMMAVFSNEHFELSGDGAPERVEAGRVSATLFPLLGTRPMLGRNFTGEEDQQGRHLVVLSYGLWQSKYGGDRNIIGRTIELDRDPYTVIGVMPEGFQFPMHGPKFNSDPAELWVPTGFTPAELQNWAGLYNHDVLGLLKPGVTVAEAQADAESVMVQVQKLWPPNLAAGAERNESLGVTIDPYQVEVVGDTRTPLLVLLGASGLVLLIACANVANLLLARASVRKKELALRAALGAGRGRLVRQVISESLLLALAAGIVGVLIAFWGVDALLSFAPATLPRMHSVGIDRQVLAFAIVLSILTVSIFGMIPALEAGNTDPREALKENERGATMGRARSQLQNVLIVSQVALAVVLLIGAGLLLRSFERLLDTDPGFQPQHILTMTIPLPYRAYSHAGNIRNFFNEMLRRTSALPGVVSAGASTDLPLQAQERDGVQIEGRDNSGQLPLATQSWILGDYFHTMGISLKRGRLFTLEDQFGAPNVVVVSETAARTYWPGQDALGKRMHLLGAWPTVVGIVGDVKDSTIQDAAAPHTYTPYLQVSDGLLEEPLFGEIRTLNLALRTYGDPSSVTSEVRHELNSLDPALAIADVQTAEASIEKSLAPQRFNLLLLGLFAALAIVLAGIGVYGILSYRTTQRLHEIGVRIALGARPRDVLVFVLRTGMLLTGLGAMIGIAAALALAQFLAGMLYQVKATDPVTFFSVVIILSGVAVLACYIPARRAMRVDPMVALRHE